MVLLPLKWILLLQQIILLAHLEKCFAFPSQSLESANNEVVPSNVLPADSNNPSTISRANKAVENDVPAVLKSFGLTSDPAALVYLVKNSNLETWLKEQGEDAFLTKGNTVLYLHRARRQSQSLLDKYAAEPTPVLPLTGEKKFNETECMPWPEAAAIIDSSMKPKHKAIYLEPVTCNMMEGLECVPVGDKEFVCQCMLIYGQKAVYANYTDEVGKLRWSCFIPAAQGYASECQGKDWNSYGYPLPFGDPPGRNFQQAAETDAFNKQDGTQIIVDYIRWNSIKPKCVPNAVCTEMGIYRGQRCQCKRGVKLDKTRGTCSAPSQQDGVINQLIAFVIIKSLFFREW